MPSSTLIMFTKAPKRSKNDMIIASRITDVLRQPLDARSGQGFVLPAKMVHIKNIDNAQVSEANDASKTNRWLQMEFGL